MEWRRFALFEALGAAMWVSLWMLFGYYVGEHAATLAKLARKFWPAALIIAGVALIGVLAVRARTRRRPG
jgi:membrane protein DedA with SNARE-associated domain